MKTRRHIGYAVKSIVMLLVSAIMLIPFIMVVVNSFKDKQASNSMNIALPTEWHPENYMVVVEQGKLVQSFLNSTLYSACSVILCVMLAAMAAFVLARNKSRLNRVLYYVIALGIATPINFVALMKVMQGFHLINTRPGLILLYTAIQLPFTVFLLTSFVASIPISLDEAGIIDGCGPMRLFFSIILPLLKPAVVTGAILCFLNTWNEFVLPLYYMNSSTAWPMTLSVYSFFGMYKSDWSLVSADIVLTSLPVILVYLLGQKYILAGMSAGAVKG